jgi:hypothetical protein
MTEIAPTLSPAPLMQITSGFWAFKTLAAAEELGLFACLAGGHEVTSAEFARALGIHDRPAEMLLTGCASLGLLEVTNGRYRNSAVAEEFLVRGKPYYFGGWIRMCDKRLYPGWGRLTEAIRTNRPTTWNPEKQLSLFEGEDPVVLELFWEAMHSLSTYSARALARAVDLSDVRRLLDVGGGRVRIRSSSAECILTCAPLSMICLSWLESPQARPPPLDCVTASRRWRVIFSRRSRFPTSTTPCCFP